MALEKVRKIRRTLFADVPSEWHVYKQQVVDLLKPGHTVLDVGCGKRCSISVSDYPDITLIGIDPDPESSNNPCLTSFKPMNDMERWPVEDETVDIVLSRHVLEHIGSPVIFFRELARVIKPSGRFVFMTPNQWSPFVVASRLLPYRLKRTITERLYGFDGSDVYPTYYKLNSSRKLRTICEDSGFSVERLIVKDFNPCTYLDFSLFGFFLACSWRSFIQASSLELQLGTTIIGTLRKN